MPERQFSGPSERNRDPILQVLQGVVREGDHVVEVASGTGMHAVWFAARLPVASWQPTDLDPANMASIAAWRAHDAVANMHDPVVLDVCQQPWPFERANLVYCANMIHISPWEAGLGLLDGAAQILPKGGALVTYGPYLQDDVPTAPGNTRFDQFLRSRDPSWGIRRLEVVAAEAAARGLHLEQVVPMPANNLTVVFRRS